MSPRRVRLVIRIEVEDDDGADGPARTTRRLHKLARQLAGAAATHTLEYRRLRVLGSRVEDDEA
jgi:hypothetical protein